MRALVVAAHPDDEVLGCGATIARLAAAGDDVTILIVGEGATSRPGDEEARELVDRLRDQTGLAAADLGASSVELLGLPDNRLDTVPLLDVVQAIERVIEAVGPSIVFTHHGGDLNIDHVILHRAVMTATRPVPGAAVERVVAFEVPSASDWAFQQWSPFRPNLFVDIGATLDAKLAALARYDTEARAFPHPRAPESIRATAARWGSTVGLPAAEAFEVIRDIRRPGSGL